MGRVSVINILKPIEKHITENVSFQNNLKLARHSQSQK